MSLVDDGRTKSVSGICAGCLLRTAHYNARRPHRALRLRPLGPKSPVPEQVHGRSRRRPILRGLINEYEDAA
jgi:hypothetical protein